MPISQRPQASGLDASIRMNAETLAKIDVVKGRFLAAVQRLQDDAVELGIARRAAEFDTRGADGILEDLFFHLVDRLTEVIDEDERLLDRVGG